MRNLKTSLSEGWPMVLLIAVGILSSSGAIRADIVERSYGDSKGEKSVKGYVLQGSRNMKKLGKRRSTTSSVILPPLSLETLSRKEPVKSVPQNTSAPQAPKPRFGYGSDYQPEGAQPVETVPAPAPVDPTQSIRFLPVKQSRTYFPFVPYYGYSSNPYFYRPGSAAGRFYFNSHGCYPGGFSAGTNFNVYHGGNLTFSSWSPVFGYRYYR